MTPILYSTNTEDFSTLGIGPLSDCISCKCNQSDGTYELTFEYPTTGVHADDIQLSQWVKAFVPPKYETSPQLFYITSISKTTNKRMQVTCSHISYWLKHLLLLPFHCTTLSSYSGGATPLLPNIKQNVADGHMYERGQWGQMTPKLPFEFTSELPGSTELDIDLKFLTPIVNVLGGGEDSVIGKLGGYIEWDNYNVNHKVTFPNKGFVINYGKDIIDVKQEEKLENVYNCVIPFWTDGTNYTTLYSASSGNSDFVYDIPDAPVNMPFRKPFALDLSEFYESAPNYNQLTFSVNRFINERRPQVPEISIDINFVELSRTEEFKNFTGVRMIDLYDAVIVRFPELGIDVESNITEISYDVLNERFEQIHVGSLGESFLDNLRTANDTLQSLWYAHMKNWIAIRNIYS